MIRAKLLHTGEACDPHACKQGVWLDVQGATPEEWAAITARYTLNPLAAEDVMEEQHWTRSEQYQEHGFISIRNLVSEEIRQEITEQLNIFVFTDALLTVSDAGTESLAQVWQMVGRDNVNTPAEITYELLDHTADTFLAQCNALEGHIDTLEEEIVQDSQNHSLKQIFLLKHDLRFLRRLALDAYDATVYFAHHAVGSSADHIRYRDAQDSFTRVAMRIEGMREAIVSLMELQINLESKQMNEVMRTLTTVSVVFLPLTFLAGVWGMNFAHMPELPLRFGYLLAWSVFVAVGSSLALYFKRRGWW